MREREKQSKNEKMNECKSASAKASDEYDIIIRYWVFCIQSVKFALNL